MLVNEKLVELRKQMSEEKIDAYIVFSADYHNSEYVGEHFRARTYISGFTGSAGTVVVTMNQACLWTDGRYFIQAAKQIEDSEFELFKIGEPDVPTIRRFLIASMESGQCVGVDGRTMTAKQGEDLQAALLEHGIALRHDLDFIANMWMDRPLLPKQPAFLLEEQYVGQSCEDKINIIREKMCQEKATMHILTKIDDIAWVLNIRGNDVPNNPVVLGYLTITLDSIYYFVDEEKIEADVRKYYEEIGVVFKPYSAIYEWIKEISVEESLLIEKTSLNYTIYKSIPEGTSIVDRKNPSVLLKAQKNAVEIENIKRAHIKDGVAMTKFMYWLKNEYKSQEITEADAATKVNQLRAEQEGYIEPSFTPISALNEHAAMMHYETTEETNVVLEEGGLYLLDSGGQYFEGTTDITRTYALGTVSDLHKIHFTAVVCGMLQLSNARFLQGAKGQNLDILARGPVWQLGIDYKCGTGHGIGFVLNVHEGPQNIRWRYGEPINDHEIMPGMITSNEPGIYIEDSHGIRIENELLAKLDVKNEHGQFMCFETITYAPIDLDCIAPEEMTRREKNYLNQFHQAVYEKISPFLTEEEVIWLKKYTREI